MTGTMQGQSHPAEPAEENQIVGEGRKLGRQDQEPGNTSWVASQSRSASNIFLHLCIQILYTLEISHLSLSGRMMFIKSRIGADVFVDLILKNLKRPHWLENNLVELPDVEVVPQRLLGPLPQLEDLNLAHLVGRGLAWPGDVAGDLRPGNDHDKAPWGLSLSHLMPSSLAAVCSNMYCTASSCVQPNACIPVSTTVELTLLFISRVFWVTYQDDKHEISLHSGDQICPGDLRKRWYRIQVFQNTAPNPQHRRC